MCDSLPGSTDLDSAAKRRLPVRRRVRSRRSPIEEQSEALPLLHHHCVQARAVAEDGPEGIRRAGLRLTHTPTVLITRGRTDDQLGKIWQLGQFT